MQYDKNDDKKEMNININPSQFQNESQSIAIPCSQSLFNNYNIVDDDNINANLVEEKSKTKILEEYKYLADCNKDATKNLKSHKYELTFHPSQSFSFNVYDKYKVLHEMNGIDIVKISKNNEITIDSQKTLQTTYFPAKDSDIGSDEGFIYKAEIYNQSETDILPIKQSQILIFSHYQIIWMMKKNKIFPMIIIINNESNYVLITRTYNNYY